MQPTVTSFHHAGTGTWSHVVADPESREAAIIDPVLDYDWKSGRTSTAAADLIVAHCRANALTVRWILETHAHADHLSSAHYLQGLLGGEIAIGQGIRSVQRTFKSLFGLGPEFQPDGSQFDRLLDDDSTLPLGDGSIHVIPTPGHTNDSVSFLIGNAVFIGDTLFMPDSGSARCDFPGGNAVRTVPLGAASCSRCLPARVCSCATTTHPVGVPPCAKRRSMSSVAPIRTSATESTKRRSCGCGPTATPRSTCPT